MHRMESPNPATLAMKYDVSMQGGLSEEQRLGRPVEVPLEDLAFVTEETLAKLLEPHALNGGSVVDIYQFREDDFKPRSLLEISYTNQHNETVQEVVYVDSLMPMHRPRVCISLAAVKAMHRGISVLTRKVDNLTLTLKSCREHYYKELFHLRHGRLPTEEHEAYWFNPKAYEDNVTKELVAQRVTVEVLDLERRLVAANAEINVLRDELEVANSDNIFLPDMLPRLRKITGNQSWDTIFQALRRTFESEDARAEAFYEYLTKHLNLWKQEFYKQDMQEEGSDGRRRASKGIDKLTISRLQEEALEREELVKQLEQKIELQDLAQSRQVLSTPRRTAVPDEPTQLEKMQTTLAEQKKEMLDLQAAFDSLKKEEDAWKKEASEKNQRVKQLEAELKGKEKEARSTALTIKKPKKDQLDSPESRTSSKKSTSSRRPSANPDSLPPWMPRTPTSVVDSIVEFRDARNDKVTFKLENGFVHYYLNDELKVTDLISLRAFGRTLQLDGTSTGWWGSNQMVNVGVGSEEHMEKAVDLFARREDAVLQCACGQNLAHDHAYCPRCGKHQPPRVGKSFQKEVSVQATEQPKKITRYTSTSTLPRAEPALRIETRIETPRRDASLGRDDSEQATPTSTPKMRKGRGRRTLTAKSLALSTERQATQVIDQTMTQEVQTDWELDPFANYSCVNVQRELIEVTAPLEKPEGSEVVPAEPPEPVAQEHCPYRTCERVVVTESPSSTSNRIAVLRRGKRVDVLEFMDVPEESAVKARIAEPPGWISVLLETDRVHRRAVKVSEDLGSEAKGKEVHPLKSLYSFAHAPERRHPPKTKECVCGSVFPAGSKFCMNCGKARATCKGVEYEISISKTQGNIGLQLDDCGATDYLSVLSIELEGLVDAWNRLHANTQVKAGDRLFQVNGIRGSPEELAAELNNSEELKITLWQSPEGWDDDDSFIVKIDREQAGEALGVELDSSNPTFLQVGSCDRGGWVADWNDEHPDAEVKPTDRIIQVNQIRGHTHLMLAEMSASRALTLTVQRQKQPKPSVEDEGYEYELELACSGGSEMGLKLGPAQHGGALVEGIDPGIVEEWNAEHPEAAVKLGDKLVAVNGEDPMRLAEHMTHSGHLRLRLRRTVPQASLEFSIPTVDAEQLGLDVTANGSVKVKRVHPGPVQRWNAAHPDVELKPGDTIAEVNGVTGHCEQLLSELHPESSHLRLRIKRDLNQLDSAPLIVTPPCETSKEAEVQTVDSEAVVINQPAPPSDFQAVAEPMPEPIEDDLDDHALVSETALENTVATPSANEAESREVATQTVSPLMESKVHTSHEAIPASPVQAAQKREQEVGSVRDTLHVAVQTSMEVIDKAVNTSVALGDLSNLFDFMTRGGSGQSCSTPSTALPSRGALVPASGSLFADDESMLAATPELAITPIREMIIPEQTWLSAKAALGKRAAQRPCFAAAAAEDACVVVGQHVGSSTTDSSTDERRQSVQVPCLPEPCPSDHRKAVRPVTADFPMAGRETRRADKVLTARARPLVGNMMRDDVQEVTGIATEAINSASADDSVDVVGFLDGTRRSASPAPVWANPRPGQRLTDPWRHSVAAGGVSSRNAITILTGTPRRAAANKQQGRSESESARAAASVTQPHAPGPFTARPASRGTMAKALGTRGGESRREKVELVPETLPALQRR